MDLQGGGVSWWQELVRKTAAGLGTEREREQRPRIGCSLHRSFLVICFLQSAPTFEGFYHLLVVHSVRIIQQINPLIKSVCSWICSHLPEPIPEYHSKYRCLPQTSLWWGGTYSPNHDTGVSVYLQCLWGKSCLCWCCFFIFHNLPTFILQFQWFFFLSVESLFSSCLLGVTQNSPPSLLSPPRLSCFIWPLTKFTTRFLHTMVYSECHLETFSIVKHFFLVLFQKPWHSGLYICCLGNLSGVCTSLWVNLTGAVEECCTGSLLFSWRLFLCLVFSPFLFPCISINHCTVESCPQMQHFKALSNSFWGLGI